MKQLLFALSVVAAAFEFVAPAKAQNYPWCAQYSTRDGSTCGFTTFQQCMATVSGIGGFCIQNNTYVLPLGLHPPMRSLRRSH